MFKIINQKKKIYGQNLKNIINLIKNENPESIFANLRDKTLAKIINLAIHSNNVILYVGKLNNKIVSYALFIKNLDLFLFNQIKFIFEIIIYIILKRNFTLLVLLILSFFKLDTIFLSSKIKKLIKISLNLHLLAVNKKFQNKGLGTLFLKRIFKSLKNYKFISLEAYDSKAIFFYKKKFNFKERGKKIRLGKFYSILIKKN